MLLLHLTNVDEAAWVDRLRRELGDYPIVRRGDAFDPAAIRYLFAWKPSPDAFEGLAGLRAILSLGAGVDALMAHRSLPPGIPIVRFVEDDLTRRMTDYVVAQVTMHQRRFTRFAADQRARNWTQFYPPAARETSVGIMGLGVLGKDAAHKLLQLGFPVRGWSRTPKTMPGVESFAGWDEFDAFLAGTDILVCLLPLTPETAGILNRDTFRKLRRRLDGGPVLVNAARGGHQREADIVAALVDGTLGAASLDVFEVEPLPVSSALWTLPNCFITPHIAAISDPNSGARYFADVIRRAEAGEPLDNVVDRRQGY